MARKLQLFGKFPSESSDAVSYNQQELTESQQMQARKNLTLPYKEEEQIEQVFSNLNWSYNQAMLEGFSLIENKEYTVKYNGETYTAPALFNDEFGIIIVNLFDNGDEIIQIGQMGEECLIMHVIGSDSVRGDEVTIRYETEVTVTLPPEYLPGPFVVNVTRTSDYNGVYAPGTADKTYDEVKAAHDRGERIVFRECEDGTTLEAPATVFLEETIKGASINPFGEYIGVCGFEMSDTGDVTITFVELGVATV